jgi:FG-GAP repeat
MALFAGTRMGGVSLISSRILIDPAGEYSGDFFGCSVAFVGDVNGDGIDDFVVGAPCEVSGGVGAGRVSVYFGASAVAVPPTTRVARLSFMGPRPNPAWNEVNLVRELDQQPSMQV